MGFWMLLFYLDAGVPVTISLYTYDHQRCLNVLEEHLKGVENAPGNYIEVIYSNCLQGSAPRRV